MHCVHVLYPRPPKSKFDLKHYYDVHMPLGIGLLCERCGVVPKKVFVQQNIYGFDGTADSAAYHVVSSLFFDSKAEADKFLELFQMEEPRRLLSEDWPKYTAADPIAVLGELVEVDPREMASRGSDVIRRAQRAAKVADQGR
jgi:uncharacterized protein (TIGR02118 family)